MLAFLLLPPLLLGGPRPPQQTDRLPRTQGASSLDLPPKLWKEVETLAGDAANRLAALQDRRGAFRLERARLPAPIAVTSLCTLALLGMGEIPGRTPKGSRIELALRYLLDNQIRDGGPKDGYFSDPADRYSKMHGHGFATLALTQALGQIPGGGSRLVSSAELRSSIRAAIRLIQRSQDKSGGWTYEPIPVGHEGSITICMVQALRAAHNIGFAVDDQVVHRAIRYVEQSQKPDGSFRYQLGSDRSSVALTAAALATLDAGGGYDSPSLAKGLAYLCAPRPSFLRPGRIPEGEGRFPFYERLYVGEALFFHKNLDRFSRWYESLVVDLSATRDSQRGSWHSPRYGEAYATAMNLLVLVLPFQYLPIHQR